MQRTLKRRDTGRKVTSLYIKDSIRDRLRAAAARSGHSMSRLIEILLDKALTDREAAR